MTQETPSTTTTALAETPEGTPPPSEPGSPLRSRRVRWLSTLSFAAVAIAGILVVLYAWRLPPFASAVETTENALVRGQVTIIGPQLAGYVVDVPVHDFQFVKAGDLLVRLDDRIYTQRLAQARAQLQQQEAALANNLQQRNSADAVIAQRQAAIDDAAAQATRNQADLRRNQDLARDGSVSRRELDLSRASHAAAVASLAQARAALEIARQDRETVVVNRAALEAAVANARAAVELARIGSTTPGLPRPGTASSARSARAWVPTSTPARN